MTDNQYETIRGNIKATIKKAKKDGIVGMSLANLKQITSTAGVTVSVSEYHQQFGVIADDVATKMKFKLERGA